MRILHLLRSFGYGGAENHVRDLANVQTETGHKVFIMAAKGNQNDLLDPRVEFSEMKMNDFSAPFQVFAVARFIRENSIDIVHAHQRLPVFIGTLSARITGIPVVVTVHGKTQYDIRSPLIRRYIGKFIFVRRSTFEEAGKYGITAGKAVIIQNGVRIAEPFGNRDNYSLCYISRIDRRHSEIISTIMTKVLPDLLEQFPGITFNIVGDGEGLPGLREEAGTINRNSGSAPVVINGYLPDVMQIIKKSGLVIGVGRVAIETLACRVPVLSVNQKYFGGLVSRENYDFFRTNNFVGYGLDAPDEFKIKSELEKYFFNIDFWQNEASYLQKRIDQDFNIYKIISSITDIYSELKDLRAKAQ
jgi:glycosyltransferase involved in cell wall biosynthesis